MLKTNSGQPDQTPRSAASHLGLHCLSMSHRIDAMLISVNGIWSRGLWVVGGSQYLLLNYYHASDMFCHLYKLFESSSDQD